MAVSIQLFSIISVARWHHSTHEPSKTMVSLFPQRYEAKATTHEVIPDPQEVMRGFLRSIPASSNTFFNSSGVFMSFVSGSKHWEYGTLLDPGMWPDGKFGRGSGSVPWNLPEDRASATWHVACDILAFTKSKSQNMPVFRVTLNGPPSI